MNYPFPTWLAWALIVALSGGLSSGCGPSPEEPAPVGPGSPAAVALVPGRGGDVAAQVPVNVLMIVMDTTRWDRCSVMGYDRPTTPNLEALAEESVTYTNMWIPAGWTGPAHASLFTGLRPVHHGFLETRLPILRGRETTLAELLRDAGWTTAALSNNLVVSEDFGLVQGFRHAPRIFQINGRRLPFSRDAHVRSLDVMDAAGRAGKPFFVFVNDYEPHLPYEPPLEWQERFVSPDVPADVLERARAWNNPLLLAQMTGNAPWDPEVLAVAPDLYDAELASLDHEIGDFVERLRQRGLLERTVIVITSDHGENFGDHGLWDHRFSVHASIRRGLLMIRFPDGRGAGTVVDDVVRTEDVFPTILEVCGLPVPAGLDGVSLLADTSGRVAPASYGVQTGPIRAFTRVYPDADLTQFRWAIEAVFDGRHHLIVRSDGHVELYDHATDADETTNVAVDFPDVVERLRGLLDG